MQVLRWQRRNILIFSALSTLVVVAEEILPVPVAILPDVPVSVLGGAIGIYVSFRTNSAYDRWWEGRKLWGQLVNSSRHYASQLLAYLGGVTDVAPLVLMHVLYVHALRVSLRGRPLSSDVETVRLAEEIGEELGELRGNACTTLLRKQLAAVTHRVDMFQVNPLRLHNLDQTLATLLDVQGGCERIKNTPLPPGYGYIAELLIRIYAIVLPMALVDDLQWLALPVSLLICLSMKLISEVGRVLEEPFTAAWEALPLLTLSHTIERDLRDALGLHTVAEPRSSVPGVVY
jgi:putative membrane protein